MAKANSTSVAKASTPLVLDTQVAQAALVSKEAAYKKAMYNAINEVDKGQDTTNPYILVNRVMKSTAPVDLKTLNGILKFNDIIISPEDFEVIKGMVSTSLPYPVPTGDSRVIGLIGTTKSTSRRVLGAYVLTHTATGWQYVGSSQVLAIRVRSYYSAKGLLETRTIAKLMARDGPGAFSLDVFVLDQSMFEPPVSQTRTLNLVVALEQYLIIHMKSVLNDVLVVGGISENVGSTEAMKQLAIKNMKVMYMYTKDMGTLVYVCDSRIGFAALTGLNIHTLIRHLKDGSTLLSTYVLSNDLLESATVALMTESELVETMALLYKDRMKVRNQLNPPAHQHPISLTDLDTGERMLFANKKLAKQHTTHVGRPLDIKRFAQPLPFTAKGWRVEESS